MAVDSKFPNATVAPLSRPMTSAKPGTRAGESGWVWIRSPTAAREKPLGTPSRRVAVSRGARGALGRPRRGCEGEDREGEQERGTGQGDLGCETPLGYRPGSRFPIPLRWRGGLHFGSCHEAKYYLVLLMARRPLQRISMTIPGDVLRHADLLARQWSRSRSWVISEAIRQLGAKPGASAAGHVVAEPSGPAYATLAIAEARAAQLRRNLALSPAERLRQAEALVNLARAVRRRPTRRQVIGFDSLEDFVQWNKARRAGA